MNTIGHFSAAAIAYYAVSDDQATRLAALGETRSTPSEEPIPLWDDDLLERLIQPSGRRRDQVVPSV